MGTGIASVLFGAMIMIRMPRGGTPVQAGTSFASVMQIMLAAIVMMPGALLANGANLTAGINTILVETRQIGCDRFGGDFIAAGFSVDLVNALADNRSFAAREDEPSLFSRRQNEIRMIVVLSCSPAGAASLVADFEHVAGNGVFERVSIDGDVDNLLTLRTALEDAVYGLLGSRPAEQAKLSMAVPAYRDYLLAIGGAQNGELSLKIRMLEKAAESSERFYPLWAQLGAAYLTLGEWDFHSARSHFDEAVRTLGRALELNPSYPFAVEALAAVYMRTGRTEEAARTVQSAIAVRPMSAALRSRLAYAFRYAGLLDESVREYRRSEALDSTIANVISAEGQIAKALIYRGRYDDALKSFDRIRNLMHEYGQDVDEKTIFYEGLAHLYLGERPKAVKLFDAAYEARPGSVWSRFALAYKYAAIDDRENLLSMAKQLEKDNVGDGERRYRLAHFYAAAGQNGDAANHLSAALEAGNFNYPYVSRDPLLESIRSTDRYEQIIRAMKKRYLAFQGELQQIQRTF